MTAHIFTANHIIALPTVTPPLDQLNLSPGFLNFLLTNIDHLTLKMASAHVVVTTTVASNSPSQDHPDDHSQSRYVTLEFKPFSQAN